jgi:hypothetical protein
VEGWEAGFGDTSGSFVSGGGVTEVVGCGSWQSTGVQKLAMHSVQTISIFFGTVIFFSVWPCLQGIIVNINVNLLLRCLVNFRK